MVGWLALAKHCSKTIMETATVSHDGEYQTVRLPTVGVRHEGESIVLEPLKPKAWPEGFFDSIHISDPAFVRPEQGQLPQVKSL
jgi:hypothetical protein